jgi:hypothetical protein
MRMRLPRPLERTLSTTNAVENLIGSVRGLGRRVKRWRDGRVLSGLVIVAGSIFLVGEVRAHLLGETVDPTPTADPL